jgi:hypothetical protein
VRAIEGHRRERVTGVAASTGTTVLRAAAVVVDGGAIAIVDRAALGPARLVRDLELLGATPLCEDRLTIEARGAASVCARADGWTLPLHVVFVLERGRAPFSVERTYDAVSLFDATIDPGDGGAEWLLRQFGTCMTVTRVARLLEARIPEGMGSGEVATHLLAAV